MAPRQKRLSDDSEKESAVTQNVNHMEDNRYRHTFKNLQLAGQFLGHEPFKAMNGKPGPSLHHFRHVAVA